MKKLLILSTAICLVAACNNAETKSAEATKSDAVTEQTQDENARLDAWFEQNFQDGIRRFPLFLAQLGIKERTDEWNDPSRKFALETVDLAKQNIKYLEENFDFDKLDAAHQLSYRLYVEGSKDTIKGDKWWGYGYPFNQMFGAQSGIPTFLLNRHRIDNEDDARNYIARLNGVDEYLGQIVANSQESAERGIMPPKFVYGHVLRDTRNVLTGLPFDDSDELNLVLADFKKKVGKLDISDEAKDALYEDATKAMLTSFKPAYDNLIAVLEEQQAKATDEDGVWKLPDGGKFYAWRLNQMTTTDLTADEIHEIGLKDVARIHGEMRAIMDKVGFEGSLQDFFTHLKTDPKFVYEDSDEGRAAYLADATEMIDVMKGRLDEVFLKKPKADLEVRRVEAFREQSAGKAFYNRPAQDGSRPGIYYANLYEITDMPKYQMEALAYHEGIPGHHMQLAIAQELEGVPKFQKFGSETAYTEGWGLYSEYLPKEMGFYEDPYSDFGRLAMEIWRSARLVVDTGLHHKKWTRQEAIDYLLENTPNPENDAIKAIERYIVMPGQATAYKIGMMKILDLREDAKTRLGDKFDIREFHDVVLEVGPVPLNVLEERVNAWVESKG